MTCRASTVNASAMNDWRRSRTAFAHGYSPDANQQRNAPRQENSNHNHSAAGGQGSITPPRRYRPRPQVVVRAEAAAAVETEVVDFRAAATMLPGTRSGRRCALPSPPNARLFSSSPVIGRHRDCAAGAKLEVRFSLMVTPGVCGRVFTQRRAQKPASSMPNSRRSSRHGRVCPIRQRSKSCG